MIEISCEIEALLDCCLLSDGYGSYIHFRDKYPRPKWWQDILDKKSL